MNMRNFLIALAIVGIVGAGSSFARPVSAQTGGIQEQIQSLLAQIADLTRQLNFLQGQAAGGTDGSVDGSGSVSVSPKHRVCTFLYRNLSRGISGDDVRSLQEFLRERGFFDANATGYFGPLTTSALARWQAAEGIEAVGIFGPVSRERVRRWCDGLLDGSNVARFNAHPQRGTAPLTVAFTTNVQLANSNMIADAGDYKVVFGDGSEYVLPCAGSAAFCSGPHRVGHTYTANGTYTATLVHFGYFGIPSSSGAPERVVGSATIYVGGGACTEEYVPVCGQKQVRCITAPCDPVQQTYSNRCKLNADGAAFLYEGRCRTDYPDPSKDPRCRVWYDGCNTCTRQAPGGLAACTLRYCFQQQQPYCKEYFDGSATGNKPPVVSSFSGPTTLSVNQTGTWTIQASDPENGALSYSIRWGDEYSYASSADSLASKAFVQTTTFTHSYARAGTYTVSITVRDHVGQTTRTTATVRVGDAIDCSVIPATLGPGSLEWQKKCRPTACTFEYAPACGLPPTGSNCPTGSICAMVEPVPTTYSNRCMLNAAGATFLYEGTCSNNGGQPIACTADARQCPDGSWVGRTGPNCEFVCPTTNSGLSTCPHDPFCMCDAAGRTVLCQ